MSILSTPGLREPYLHRGPQCDSQLAPSRSILFSSNHGEQGHRQHPGLPGSSPESFPSSRRIIFLSIKSCVPRGRYVNHPPRRISSMIQKSLSLRATTGGAHVAGHFAERASSRRNVVSAENVEAGEERPVDVTEGKRPLSGFSAQLRSQSLGMSNSEEWIQEQKRQSEERLQKGLGEYATLKRDLLASTVGVGGLGSAYCLLTLSLQSSLSYFLGSFAGVLYLLLLFRDSDNITATSLPPVFTAKRPRRKGLVDSRAAVDSFEKVVSGVTLALRSQRLIVPAILISLWAASLSLQIGDDGAHLELGPLFLGFLSYKAAILIRTFRENQDLLF